MMPDDVQMEMEPWSRFGVGVACINAGPCVERLNAKSKHNTVMNTI